jgi:small-conductance mechanosensitive channel
VRLLRRTFDKIEVPARIRPTVAADFRAAVVTGTLAVICLGVVGSIGNVHAHAWHQRIVALGGAVVFLVLAALTVRSVGSEVHRVLASRVGESHAAVVQLLITVAGFAIAILGTLGLLAVPVQHLLLGGALTGVIIGIAAQQALGNVFAGLVLLLARPFNVGDEIRIRSSALGGELLGRVTGMGMSYVTLGTSEGPLAIPNSMMLAAGIGPRVEAAASLDLTEGVGERPLHSALDGLGYPPS